MSEDAVPDIDDERRNRYRDKLDLLNERLDDIQGWMGDDTTLPDRKKDMFAVFKAFQEAVEIVADTCTMYLSDTGHGIGDDRENMDKAAGDLYPEELAGALGEANGLRNRIVHDYNGGFDAQQAVSSMTAVLDSIETFHEEARRWISTR